MRIRIHYKITIILSVFMAVTLAGAYIYLNSNLTANAYQRIRNNLTKDLSISRLYLEKNLSKPINFQDMDQIADLIGRTLNIRATIISLDGTVLGDSQLNSEEVKNVEGHGQRPEIQQASRQNQGESRRFSTTVKMDMLYMAQPFHSQNGSGFIRLAIPLAEINQLSQNLRRLLLYSFLWVFIFIIIAGYLASFIFTKPILKTSSIAQAIAGGDFSQKVIVNSNDEMEELAKSINYMSEQIKSRMNEVLTNKSRMEAVLLSMVEGVMVLDKSGSIILLNQALRSFLQIEKEAQGHKPIEIIRNIEIQDLADKVLKADNGVQVCELNVLLPEEKILLVHATPVIREAKIDGAVLVFHNITELRRLEKVRQDFVANVSHELRTPVSTIKGYAETLLDGAIDDKDNARDFIEIIHQDSQRLANLVNDLLDLSKIESGKMNLEYSEIALKPAIERVVKALDKKLLENNLKVSIDVSDQLPQVKADENSISQILLNLIENAIKYNVDSGSIKITAEENGRFIKVNITDSGIGIPEQDLPRIFERFYRVDKAHSRKQGGTGLGLSIVKHLVQTNGGEVFVQSRFKAGSTFSFTLPKA